jgi:sigma-B regulation protein RsbU (phosphoserine phosphatase)
MDTITLDSLRHQLEERRGRLQGALDALGPTEDLVRLLQHVDAALSRLGTDDFARCIACNGHLDDEELQKNPIAQFCLCDLSPAQQRALEQDLGLAWRIQAALLPDPDHRSKGWSFHYRYEPAGPVSGDYCDIWDGAGDGQGTYFFVGDVSGKGVSASLLMAHLHAALRSREDMGATPSEMVERANRLLLRHTLASHYATLVSGRAGRDGEVEIVNAGHCLPLVVRARGVEAVASSGFPVGLVADRPYEVQRVRLEPGDALFLHTDGLSEARARDGSEYGAERVQRLLGSHYGESPRALAASVRADLQAFLDGATVGDDLTLLAVRRDA